MEKQFVPYELALKLKELGFNEQCFAGYREYGKDNIMLMMPSNKPFLNINDFGYKEYSHQNKHVTKAPLWQQAFDWFRDKYGFYLFEDHRCCCTRDINNIQYWFGIKRTMLAPYGSKVEKGLIEMGCFKTYKEAREQCLKKLIELCKKN